MGCKLQGVEPNIPEEAPLENVTVPVGFDGELEVSVTVAVHTVPVESTYIELGEQDNVRLVGLDASITLKPKMFELGLWSWSPE